MSTPQKPVSTCFTLILLLTLYFPLQAGARPIHTLTAPEVKNMMDKGTVTLIHTLSEIEFNIQHIPGSINIPIIDMETTDKLPVDQNTPLIFYCMAVR